MAAAPAYSLIGINILRQQTLESVSAGFTNHQQFVSDLCRLTLSPTIYNLDKLFTETNATVRTAREWASTLVDEKDNLLKADAVNSGYDSRCFLLVPSKHINLATMKVDQYKKSIANPPIRQQQIFQGRPNTVYVPSTIAKMNLEYLSSMFSTNQTTPPRKASPAKITPNQQIKNVWGLPNSQRANLKDDNSPKYNNKTPRDPNDTPKEKTQAKQIKTPIYRIHNKITIHYPLPPPKPLTGRPLQTVQNNFKISRNKLKPISNNS